MSSDTVVKLVHINHMMTPSSKIKQEVRIRAHKNVVLNIETLKVAQQIPYDSFRCSKQAHKYNGILLLHRVKNISEFFKTPYNYSRMYFFETEIIPL